MLRYIIRRLAALLIVALGATLLTFFIMHLAPGDPAEMVALARYGQENLTRESIELVRQGEGLDKPIFIQYGRWLLHIVKGEWGNSLSTGEPVLEEILARFPHTLQLTLAALMISLLISLPIGILAAVKHNTVTDYLAMSIALLGVSVPAFWLGLLFMLLFGLYLSWLPVCGYGSLRHLILPALTLGCSMAAITTRLTRANMLDVMEQEYIISARARGIRERDILARHALKNAFIPVVTMLGIQAGHLLEGAVVIETVFAWPGLGKLLVDSIFARDFALIQGCVLFFAALVVIANLLVDISYLYLDPRIRFEREM